MAIRRTTGWAVTCSGIRCSGTGHCDGGFSEAEPWLPVVDAAERNVADQRNDPNSLLNFWRTLITLRRQLAPGFRDARQRTTASSPTSVASTWSPSTRAMRRGVVPAGEVVLATSAAVSQTRRLPPGTGVLVTAV